ncbi:DUF5643 domain-containing protein [Paenibacillus senegalensis]|uniref:DUF5643 domain-containing protein n=1 Tax=Paenibacillus senegalensis TaxID=1465766 RepID=UPI0011DCA51D|nr:DUF5643 domain-containing protein [Paenibacillus senegalensis]
MLRTLPAKEPSAERTYFLHNEFENVHEAALNSSLYQAVGQSIEELPFPLTIEGFAADDQRLLVYYSMGGDSQIYGMQLLDEQGEVVPAMSSYSNVHLQQKQSDIDVADFHLSSNETMPEQVLLRIDLPELAEPFDIRLKIDPQPFQGTREELAVNQAVETDGQTILVSKAIITPLQTTLVTEYAADNSKEINGLIDLKLTDGQGREHYSFGSVGSLTGVMEHFFQGYFTSHLEKLSVSWAGIQATEKNQHIVVDLKRQRLLQAPDERLALHDVRTIGDEWKLSFRLSELNERERQRTYTLIGSNFRDGAGEEYSLSEQAGVSSTFNNGRNELVVQFTLPNEEYEQPLTFQVQDYPGFVTDPVELELK